MIKLTEIIGSQVISIWNGKSEGYLASALKASGNGLKKISAFKLIDEETETAKSLNTKDIYSLQAGYVLIKNASKVLISAEPEDSDSVCLINKTAINLASEKIGTITDVFLDDKFNITSIMCDSIELDIAKVVSVGESFVVVNNLDEYVNSSHFKPKHTISPEGAKKDGRTVTIAATKLPELYPIPTPLPYPQSAPIKFTSSNSYLIGKRSGRDVISTSDELIIRKNAIITARTLKLAKHFSKLKELASFAY